jgi:hypothetical protein
MSKENVCPECGSEYILWAYDMFCNNRACEEYSLIKRRPISTGTDKQEEKTCLSCPNTITEGDYCSECSDTPDGRSPETMSKSVIKRLAVQRPEPNSDEIREVNNEIIAGEFIQAYGQYDGRLDYRKDLDIFVLRSASMPFEAEDLYNTKYTLYKKGRLAGIKSQKSLIDEAVEYLKEAMRGLEWWASAHPESISNADSEVTDKFNDFLTKIEKELQK